MDKGATNLTEINWAHAVNSQKQLEDALKSDIDMIEADIVLGTVNNTGSNQPVMGHPPQINSDISLESFLRIIIDHNCNQSNSTKGIKLDFKSIEVFEESLSTLRELVPKMTTPIWLNADIIHGPVNECETVPVDPDRFFAGCSNFENTVLSIGWTTRWGPKYTEGSYTEKQITDMLETIKKNHARNAKHKITFPVRAGIAAQSLYELNYLMQATSDTNEISLTIWSSVNDNVDIPKLRNLIFYFGFDRVYLDVPEDVLRKLELARGPDDFMLPN